jgi:hypothetical protein
MSEGAAGDLPKSRSRNISTPPQTDENTPHFPRLLLRSENHSNIVMSQLAVSGILSRRIPQDSGSVLFLNTLNIRKA